jgi:hypothetical protein
MRFDVPDIRLVLTLRLLDRGRHQRFHQRVHASCDALLGHIPDDVFDCEFDHCRTQSDQRHASQRYQHTEGRRALLALAKVARGSDVTPRMTRLIVHAMLVL